jgi:membrane associated rhomboid family serine protease
MSTCDVCGEEESMPYHCRHCGGTYCSNHRLPEAHDCPGLENWGDPDGVFDSGFDASVEPSSGGRGGTVARKLPIDTGVGGPLGYFRGNMSYVFLGVIWIVYLAELIVVHALNDLGLFYALFVLDPGHLEYAWTWVTSIFSHDPVGFYHIAGNSIVLYFFGPVLERQVGSKKFAILWFASGFLASVAQFGLSVGLGDPLGPVLGASGAIMAIMAALTVLAPNLRVYLYFILPVPLWVITFGYAGLSLFALSSAGVMANVAHGAHLGGLVVGLAAGWYFKERGVRGPRQLEFGGGPGGPGGSGGPGGRRRGPF